MATSEKRLCCSSALGIPNNELLTADTSGNCSITLTASSLPLLLVNIESALSEVVNAPNDASSSVKSGLPAASTRGVPSVSIS